MRGCSWLALGNCRVEAVFSRSRNTKLPLFPTLQRSARDLCRDGCLQGGYKGALEPSARTLLPVTSEFASWDTEEGSCSGRYAWDGVLGNITSNCKRIKARNHCFNSSVSSFVVDSCRRSRTNVWHLSKEPLHLAGPTKLKLTLGCSWRPKKEDCHCKPFIPKHQSS